MILGCADGPFDNCLTMNQYTCIRTASAPDVMVTTAHHETGDHNTSPVAATAPRRDRSTNEGVSC